MQSLVEAILVDDIVQVIKGRCQAVVDHARLFGRE
jgi:hypothetical protein